MSLRIFYATLLLALATVLVLSLTWEFWLEDRLLSILAPYHEMESREERWEFVVTVIVFSSVALIAPVLIGDRIIRRDQVLRGEVIRLSQEDSLTGLYNRRKIRELLENEVQRAARYKVIFSVIMLDIDHFKNINDRFGHQVGDQILTNITDVIRSSVREADLVGRWGGEEFVIVSPETSLDGCLSLAEKIRSRLESAELDHVGPVTASLGVTSFASGDSLDSIIARADAGLYAAKLGGRNRVEKGVNSGNKILNSA